MSYNNGFNGYYNPIPTQGWGNAGPSNHSSAHNPPAAPAPNPHAGGGATLAGLGNLNSSRRGMSFAPEQPFAGNTSWSCGPYQNVPYAAAADCGQHASGTIAGGYQVAPLYANGMPAQPFQAMTPTNFGTEAAHFSTAFRHNQIPDHIPPNAKGVAFSDPFNGKFHYARIERDANGVPTHLTQTDANRHHVPGNGGTFNTLRRDNTGGALRTISQRGVAPPERLNRVADFVNYCQNTYGEGLYYFCDFRPQ